MSNFIKLWMSLLLNGSCIPPKGTHYLISFKPNNQILLSNSNHSSLCFQPITMRMTIRITTPPKKGYLQATKEAEFQYATLF